MFPASFKTLGGFAEPYLLGVSQDSYISNSFLLLNIIYHNNSGKTTFSTSPYLNLTNVPLDGLLTPSAHYLIYSIALSSLKISKLFVTKSDLSELSELTNQFQDPLALP